MLLLFLHFLQMSSILRLCILLLETRPLHLALALTLLHLALVLMPMHFAPVYEPLLFARGVYTSAFRPWRLPRSCLNASALHPWRLCPLHPPLALIRRQWLADAPCFPLNFTGALVSSASNFCNFAGGRSRGHQSVGVRPCSHPRPCCLVRPGFIRNSPAHTRRP